METHQSESQTNNFNTHFAKASAEHDLLINFVDPSSEFHLQTNKDNHSHSDSLCLAAHKIEMNSRNWNEMLGPIIRNKMLHNVSYIFSATKHRIR